MWKGNREEPMAAPKLAISSLTTKFQATVPADIRARLKLKAGDKIRFVVNEAGEVVVMKVSPLDDMYLAAVGQTLTEWSSPEDEEAFGGL
jgi:antitoxin PrlF